MASRQRSTRARTVVALPLVLVLAVAVTGCGDDDSTLASSTGGSTTSPSPSGGTATPTASASPSAPNAPEGDEPAPATAAPAAPAGTAAPSRPAGPQAPSEAAFDLDGDGRADEVDLLAVAGMGWSFEVTLADGRRTSAPLPADLAVAEDVAVVGAIDLDRDGRDEVVVRTLRAVGGENAVVFRMDGDGAWLVRTPQGAPWELATSGGMSGPRSYDCTDLPGRPGREIRTRESSREGTADAAPTYAVTTRTWALSGHTAVPVAEQSATGVAADAVQLDPATCER